MSGTDKPRSENSEAASVCALYEDFRVEDGGVGCVLKKTVIISFILARALEYCTMAYASHCWRA